MELSQDDIKRLSDECLADPEFIKRFQNAVNGEAIPDAAKDPEAYQEFMRRVQGKLAEDVISGKEGEIFEDKDGTWTFTLPEQVFCIKATDESGKKKVFINICKSKAIQEPMPMTTEEIEDSGMKNEALQFRVPISIGPPRVDKDKAGVPAMVYDIAVNPLTLDKCSADPEFKRLVCAMCLYGLKQKHEPDLNTDQYKQPNIKCKGKIVTQRVRVTRKQAQDKNAFNDEIALGKKDSSVKISHDPTAPTAPTARGNPARKIEVIGEEAKESRELKPGEGTEAFYSSTKDDYLNDEEEGEQEPARQANVEEVGEYEWGVHKRPELNSYWRARVKVPARLRVTVHLPEVQATIRECNVDVRCSSVHIYSVDDEDLQTPYYEVELRFPVDPDVTEAKFMKKKKMLTLVLTVKLPDEEVQQVERREATKAEVEKEEEAERKQEALDEEERKERLAKVDRQRKEEEAQQQFNKQLAETAQAVQSGGVPPEMQQMIDDMSPNDAKLFLARLTEGTLRGDHVDQILEKLPKTSQLGLISAIREKLGLEDPDKAHREEAAKKAREAEQKKKDARKAGKNAGSDDDDDDDDPTSDAPSFGFDKMAKKLFGQKLKNRYLFALDL